ncbi:hypothetical protein PanWU01x14_221310 [Parasponia andersonii]|uniref:Uncharacterized protein n=1 Tax=Parasponia andersonii TaxID=3476 RepID=A0A2P5BPN8_PARAD|nr:hypothetical protein PanWU01x14_221310 [Parasponia andersonii]
MPISSDLTYSRPPRLHCTSPTTFQLRPSFIHDTPNVAELLLISFMAVISALSTPTRGCSYTVVLESPSPTMTAIKAQSSHRLAVCKRQIN